MLLLVAVVAKILVFVVFFIFFSKYPVFIYFCLNRFLLMKSFDGSMVVFPSRSSDKQTCLFHFIVCSFHFKCSRIWSVNRLKTFHAYSASFTLFLYFFFSIKFQEFCIRRWFFLKIFFYFFFLWILYMIL